MNMKTLEMDPIVCFFTAAGRIETEILFAKCLTAKQVRPFAKRLECIAGISRPKKKFGHDADIQQVLINLNPG
jgi:hypothetical protein